MEVTERERERKMEKESYRQTHQAQLEESQEADELTDWV